MMRDKTLWRALSALFWIVMIKSEAAVNFEQQLRRELFTNRKLNPISRPGRYHNDTMNLAIQNSVLYLHKLDPRKNILKMTTWLALAWANRDLAWNPRDYGGIAFITVKPSSIWIPYITLLNSAVKMDQSFLHTTHARVQYTGQVSLINPVTVESHCVIDIHRFPFDRHSCTLIFGSWTQDGTHINVSAVTSEETDFVPISNDFHLTQSNSRRSTYRNTCCREIYSVAIFDYQFERRSSLYQVGVLLPAALICLLTAGVFWVAPLTGHRLTMGLILLIANLILLMSLSLLLPISSTATPSIIIFCAHALGFTTFSLVLSMVSINLSSKHPSISTPVCIQNLTDGWLAKYFFVNQDEGNTVDKENNGWLTLVVILDRLSFVLFCVSFLLLFTLYLH